MKPFDFADIIYAATGISAQQFPDEYKGILAACEMAVAQERGRSGTTRCGSTGHEF